MRMAGMKMFSGMMAGVAILGCTFFMGVQTVLAESLRSSDQDGMRIVEQKRVEQITPGSYHYRSSYEITKDENKT